MDSVEPLEPIDAATWAEQAEREIRDIVLRGRVPIVCGGSFLWVRALISGLVPVPPANAAIRERHRETVVARGRLALHAELARVDEASAARLSPNDFVRVSRALEVFELTGAPLSRWQADHGFRKQRYAARLVAIQNPAAELDRRIAERVAAMLRAGWADEVASLLERGFETARAMQSVGYRQLAAAIRGGRSCDDPELFEEIRRATRVFARRQRTWLRQQPVLWLSPEEIPLLRFEELMMQSARSVSPA
jgi:tRNA dimethylallyltransferase